MTSLTLTVFVYTGALVICSVPALIVARLRQRPRMARNFLVTAAALGLFGGLLSAGSERLVEQCQARGNPNCFDSGASGLLLMIVVGYMLTALIRAFIVFQD